MKDSETLDEDTLETALETLSSLHGKEKSLNPLPCFSNKREDSGTDPD